MWEEANEYFACNPREKLWLNKNLRARFPCKDSGELFGSQVERHGRPMDGDVGANSTEGVRKMIERS